MDNRLAWRNIWRNPRRTLIIMTAIFIGVFSMLVLAALMRGMVGEMVHNAIHTLTGHVRISQGDYRSDPSIDNRISEPETVLAAIGPNLPEGARVAARIQVDAMVSNARHTLGVTLVGVDPDEEIGVSFIGDGVAEGYLFREGRGLVAGRGLLTRMGTGLGKKVVIMTQGADGEVSSRGLRIVGVYTAALEATEKQYLFLPRDYLAEMLGVPGEVTEISVILPRGLAGGKEATRLAGSLGSDLDPGLAVEAWPAMLPAITAYLTLFEGVLVIWYVVVFVAMGFGIVNTVLMAVYERMKEFGLLMALGMGPGQILSMVMRETTFLIVGGVMAGNAVGGITLWILSIRGIDLSAFAQGAEMFGISRVIYPLLTPRDLLTANGTVMVLGLAVALYPALKAARLTPVETLRRV